MTRNRALPTHPRFGRALGWTRRGPIWPAAGGSEPPADAPPAPAPDPPKPAEQPKPDEPLGEPGKAALAAEREARKGLERELAKYKKADQDKADADKSEADKRTAAEAKVAELEAALLKRDVASEKGLTPAQAKRLLGSTREELEADADEILADFASRTPAPPAAPKPDLSQGHKGGPEPRSPNLGAAVTKALNRG